MKKFNLEIIAFICGACVMILEMIGSRMLAPYIGSSTFVWTSLIGVILGSLSVGYWLGGKLADKGANYTKLAFINFLIGIWIFMIIIINNDILLLLNSFVKDIRISSLIAAIILFAIPSILFGLISPYVARLKMYSVESSGATIGNLYSISTMGSIVGTFLTGFLLISLLGTMKILFLLSFIMLITSFVAEKNKFLVVRILTIIVICMAFVYYNNKQNTLRKNGFIDVDTQYARVWIYDKENPKTKQRIRTMRSDDELSSAMILGDNELAYDYTRYYNLIRYFYSDFKNTLMIGGAGYSYPKYYLDKYPNARIDVVEIDPKRVELAKKYFGLKENKRLQVFHEDGRIFFNNNKNKYDTILMDAFKSRAIPFHLTTIESVKKMYSSLSDNGVLITNIISAVEGEKGEFLRAEYATYKKVFPQVYLFPVQYYDKGDVVQNVIIVALKSQDKPSFVSKDNEISEYLKHLWKKDMKLDMPILTDDYAPIEKYLQKMIF